MNKLELAVKSVVEEWLSINYNIYMLSSSVEADMFTRNSGGFTFNGETDNFEIICASGIIDENRVILEKFEIDYTPSKLEIPARLRLEVE